MVKYFIFFIFFGLACMHSSYSQKSENIRFVHIGPNEGISQSTVVDITRIFCGLNDARNIIPSIKYALEAGMIPQATLCITS